MARLQLKGTLLLFWLVEICAYSPNTAVVLAAKGMSLIKPVFQAEAKIQSAILGAVGGIKEEDVVSEIAREKKENKAFIYTYSLSPFSSEALNILDDSGYEYTKIELGAEWFLLGPKNSVKRDVLSKEVEDGATSLPKIFIGEKCIGGCNELASLVKSGELDILMASAKVKRKGQKKTGFSIFQ